MVDVTLHEMKTKFDMFFDKYGIDINDRERILRFLADDYLEDVRTELESESDVDLIDDMEDEGSEDEEKIEHSKKIKIKRPKVIVKDEFEKKDDSVVEEPQEQS